MSMVNGFRNFFSAASWGIGNHTFWGHEVFIAKPTSLRPELSGLVAVETPAEPRHSFISAVEGQMSPARPAQHEFKSLDGMRGIAALAVVYLHICKLFFFPEPLRAHLAVDFFFMLSGFVLAQAYSNRLTEGWPWYSFLKKRVIRLYPMIIVGSALGLLVLVSRRVLNHDVSWGGIASVAFENILLIPSNGLAAFRASSFTLNSPFWSLSTEMVVNIVFGLVAAKLTTSRLVIVLAISGIALAWASLYSSGLDIGFNYSDYWLGIIRTVFPFFAGVTLKYVVDWRPTHWAFDILAFISLGAVLLTSWAPVGGGEWVSVVVVLPCLLGLGALANPPKSLARVWTALGELSFPLYAVHYPIVVVFAQVVKGHHLKGTPLILAALVCAVATVAAAQLALILFDRPVRAALTKRFDQRRRPDLETVYSEENKTPAIS